MEKTVIISIIVSIFYIWFIHYFYYEELIQMTNEFIVTGQLKERNDNQTLILHGSFFVTSKEDAIKAFYDHFNSGFEIIKIYSVIDDQGNIL